MRRLPVESSRTSLSRKSVMPSISSSSSTRASTSSSASITHGRWSAAATGIAHVEVAFERERDRLPHAQRAEQPAVLERAAEPEPGPRRRAARG